MTLVMTFFARSLSVLVVVGFLFVVLFVHPTVPTVRAAEEPTLKIMTYNTWTAAKTNQDVQNEMRSLAQYIKNNQIEIAALQEVNDWKNWEGSTKLNGDDAVFLDQFLKEIDYPMHWYAKPYQKGIGLGYRNVTFSKYPIIEGGYADFEITKNKRWGVITTFKTPLGLVTTMNIHTYAKTDFKIPLCDQVAVIGKKMLAMSPNPRLIALGDWNVQMHQKKWCPGSNWPEKFTFLCDNACKANSDKRSIDFAMALKETDFTLVDDWVDYSYTYSDHFPVISVLKLKTPPSTPPPVIPPPPLPDPVIISATCQADRSSDTQLSSKLVWRGVAGAEKYMLRIHSPKNCSNEQNQLVDWYCPNETAPLLGDRVIFVKANEACKSAFECTATIPVAPAVTYPTWSVQAMMTVDGTKVWSEQIISTTPLICYSADVNADGAVNTADYNQLVSDLYTNACRSNIVGACPLTTGAAITIQDFNELIGVVR